MQAERTGGEGRIAATLGNGRLVYVVDLDAEDVGIFARLCPSDHIIIPGPILASRRTPYIAFASHRPAGFHYRTLTIAEAAGEIGRRLANVPIRQVRVSANWSPMLLGVTRPCIYGGRQMGG